MAAMLVIPATGASAADHCDPISGTAMFNFGDNVGFANVSYDGERQRVPFESTGFQQTGDNTADVFFTFYFPQGIATVVEHAVSTPKGGPAAAFESTIEGTEGTEADWTWGGTANLASGRAAITNITGTLCFPPE